MKKSNNGSENKISYWINLAEYDMETAISMLKCKRYLYVGFMCHQVIEKALKGYFAFKHDKIPPYTHNLNFLSDKCGLTSDMTKLQNNFIDVLEPLNVGARYPKYKGKLIKTLTPQKCKSLIKNTEGLFEWIKKKLLA